MGFAQWFWRLFLVFSGIVAAHVLTVTLLLAGRGSGGSLIEEVWLIAAVTIAVGAVATWYSVRQIIQPLADLTRQVRSVVTSEASPPGSPTGQDEVRVLTGAFDQMQRDLARRLDQIQDNSQRLQSVLSNMAEGVLAVAPDKTILLANESARRLLDFVTARPVGRSLLEATRARPVVEAMNQALESHSAVITEFEAPGFPRRTLSLRATRLPGEPCPGVLMVLHDMTELRRLESLRRELVANVSHELKTPLAAIKGYAETLRLGAVNDQEHNLHFVRRIEEQADRLHELILDILKIARLESGQETFDLTDVPIADVLDDCIQQFAEAAAAKSIALDCQRLPGGVTAYADTTGVRTIVNNLVDNAIKYTPTAGQIHVRARADADKVEIEVQDTGVGIAEAELARIFERFYRVEKARSRDLGGTGLGLSIVKHLAHSFGGSVSVVSKPGVGSTFRVQLPRAAGGAA
jgi:two-component system, OmpR family, phosphate regulon sensor histidine kinase PhoR